MWLNNLKCQSSSVIIEKTVVIARPIESKFSLIGTKAAGSCLNRS